MVAEHQRLDISIASAYKILKNEEDFYRTATADERVRIDRERVARDLFLREMIEKENEKQRKRHERAAKKERAETESADQLFNEADALSEEEIEARLRNRAHAMDWLVSLLGGARTVSHLLVWQKIWSAVPGALKNEFKRFMVHAHGVDIERVLDDVENLLADHEVRESKSRKLSRAELEEQAELRKAKRSGDDVLDGAMNDSMNDSMSDSNDDSRIDGDLEDSENPHAAKQRGPQSRGERDELIKIIYRKLVRRLHPDLNGTSQKEVVAWQKTIWHRVQKAHESFDLSSLERLYRMVLVRSRDLSEVTMGEILESHSWLQKEISELNSEVSANKQAPAWGFSRRKNYDALQRKVEKTILGDLHLIDSELREMQEQFQMLEALASGEIEMERSGLTRSRSSGRNRRPPSAEAQRRPKSRARRRR